MPASSLEGMVLKPNMVIAGQKAAKQASAQEVAEKLYVASSRRSLRPCQASLFSRAANRMKPRPSIFL